MSKRFALQRLQKENYSAKHYSDRVFKKHILSQTQTFLNDRSCCFISNLFMKETFI